MSTLAALVMAASLASTDLPLRPPLCLPLHTTITEALEQQDESVVGYGVTGLGAIIQVWVSERGSWSIVLITPDGIGCMLEAGEAWEPALGKPL